MRNFRRYDFIRRSRWNAMLLYCLVICARVVFRNKWLTKFRTIDRTFVTSWYEDLEMFDLLRLLEEFQRYRIVHCRCAYIFFHLNFHSPSVEYAENMKSEESLEESLLEFYTCKEVMVASRFLRPVIFQMAPLEISKWELSFLVNFYYIVSSSKWLTDVSLIRSVDRSINDQRKVLWTRQSIFLLMLQ